MPAPPRLAGDNDQPLASGKLPLLTRKMFSYIHFDHKWKWNLTSAVSRVQHSRIAILMQQKYIFNKAFLASYYLLTSDMNENMD